MTRVLLTLARPSSREVARRAAYLAALQRAGTQTEGPGRGQAPTRLRSRPAGASRPGKASALGWPPEPFPPAPSLEVLALFPGEKAPEDFDALCLSGGGDVDPSRYGAANEASTFIDEERDALELDLVERAVRRRVPVLGICRGMQLLNVALGGKLLQHREGHSGAEARHEVVVAPRTLLEAACGRGPFRVNSWHHQAVRPRDLARGLVATVVVDDLIEAFEAPHFGWLIGVQWHPERTHEVDEPATRIFMAFVGAARAAGEGRPGEALARR